MKPNLRWLSSTKSETSTPNPQEGGNWELPATAGRGHHPRGQLKKDEGATREGRPGKINTKWIGNDSAGTKPDTLGPRRPLLSHTAALGQRSPVFHVLEHTHTPQWWTCTVVDRVTASFGKIHAILPIQFTPPPFWQTQLPSSLSFSATRLFLGFMSFSLGSPIPKLLISFPPNPHCQRVSLVSFWESFHQIHECVLTHCILSQVAATYCFSWGCLVTGSLGIFGYTFTQSFPILHCPHGLFRVSDCVFPTATCSAQVLHLSDTLWHQTHSAHGFSPSFPVFPGISHSCSRWIPGFPSFPLYVGTVDHLSETGINRLCENCTLLIDGVIWFFSPQTTFCCVLSVTFMITTSATVLPSCLSWRQVAGLTIVNVSLTWKTRQRSAPTIKSHDHIQFVPQFRPSRSKKYCIFQIPRRHTFKFQ